MHTLSLSCSLIFIHDATVGKNDGSVTTEGSTIGVSYFFCPPGHGIFVRPDAVYPDTSTVESSIIATVISLIYAYRITHSANYMTDSDRSTLTRTVCSVHLISLPTTALARALSNLITCIDWKQSLASIARLLLGACEYVFHFYGVLTFLWTAVL